MRYIFFNHREVKIPELNLSF